MHYTANGQCFSNHPPKRRQNPVVFRDRMLIPSGGRAAVPLTHCGVLLCAAADPSIRWYGPSGRRNSAVAAAAGAQEMVQCNVLVSQAKAACRTGSHAGLLAVGLRL